MSVGSAQLHLRLDVSRVWVVEDCDDGGHAVCHARHHEAQAKGSHTAHQPKRPLLLVVLPQPPKASLDLSRTELPVNFMNHKK